MLQITKYQELMSDPFDSKPPVTNASRHWLLGEPLELQQAIVNLYKWSQMPLGIGFLGGVCNDEL